MMLKKYLIIALSLLIACFLQAQDLKVSAHLDSDTILIGDQIHVTLSIQPKGRNITFPVLYGELGQIEILKNGEIDTIKQGTNLILEKKYLVTAFEPTRILLDQLFFALVQNGNETDTIFVSGSKPLIVNTIAVDTTQAIKDIKPIMEEPVTFTEWWQQYKYYAISLITALVLGIIVLIIVLRKKKKRPIFPFMVKPSLPAHVVALKKLEELKQKKLWQHDFVKEYYVELTAILREYLAGRFKINAEEKTSDEILEACQNISLTAQNEEILQYILKLADLVKFAKHQPLPDEHTRCLSGVSDFIQSTISKPEEEDKTNLK